MNDKKYEIAMEVAGNTAMWTRPDTGDCPCSYPAPTYSASKGIFESILWGPAISIIPTRVEICKPIQYHSYVTNYGGPNRSNPDIKSGNNYQLVATVLVDVCYKLYAVVEQNNNRDSFNLRSRLWDAHTTSPGHAYKAIFERRLNRGQSFGTVSLGWREFTTSYVGPLRSSTHACEELPDIVIPSMLRTVFDSSTYGHVGPRFDTDVRIHDGTLIYPLGGDNR
ncbi:CRISPR-associated protein Cas5 [Olsenella sp. Marseille-P4559]|uniref:CRISPR-associated protein Cas5 n=1 Tax=Olsenella sp. Marseille-P4559 TaxID=2364795 RepID=UPI001A90F11C|nr:CRISPR-associated protein Cas5 [Olsenella sp. Marseille-P4559]